MAADLKIALRHRATHAVLVLSVIACVPIARGQTNDGGRQTEIEARESERQRRQREIEDARTRQLVERLVATTKETCDLLARLETTASAFQARLASLLTDSDGKKLAQDPVAFLGFVSLQEQPIISIEQVKVRKRNGETMLQAVNAELARPSVGWLPDDTQRREIDGLYFWARERMEQIEERTAWLTSVLDKSPKEIDLTMAKPLEAVLRDYKARQMELWAKARAEGEAAATEESRKVVSESARDADLERSRGEAERLLNEARAEIASLKAQFELQMKTREAEQHKQTLETDMKHTEEIARLERELQLAKAKREAEDMDAQVIQGKIERETEKKRLIEKCNDSEVKTLLAPFLAEGYWQPGGGVHIEKIPVSFSKLRACGALRRDAGGLQKLLECGTRLRGTNKPSDAVRPRWGYDPRLTYNKPEGVEDLKKAQELLNELGETMVELKVLSP